MLVLEEHQEIGVPTNCSGLIGAEAFERYELPRHTILRAFDRARFISPAGYEALVSAGRPVAYVVDRAEFDRSLARRAAEAGAVYRLGSRCLEIDWEDEGVRVMVKGTAGEVEVLRARALVLATGVRYGLLQALGGSRPGAFVSAAQAEVTMKGVEEVEVFLGSAISPGSFAWAIPLSGDRVKLGVCNRGRALYWMQRLLSQPRVAERMLDGGAEIKTKPIPVYPAKRTYWDRILVVGDTAGQVKPTTAGGIYYGIRCAEIAARVLDGAFKRGDFSRRTLANYQRSWQREIGRELKIGRYFRWLGSKLSDSQIDHLVRAYRQPEFRDLVHRTADFERHSRFILALLSSPIFWAGLVDPLKNELLKRWVND